MTSRQILADCAIALLLAVAVTALNSATSFGRVFGGDGKILSEWTANLEHANWNYHNTLYLPAAQLCAAVLPRGLLAAADDPLALGKSLSALAAGIGAAFSYLCCRLLGAKPWPGVAGTALVVLSPGVWGFGSLIEVHTQHFGTVAICAFVTLLLPWRRPVLATALATAVFVIPCMSHQTAPLLGPGWILLVQCARRRVGPPFSWTALLAVGTALLVAVVLGHVLVQWRRGQGLGMAPGELAGTVMIWYQGFRPFLLWTEVLCPLFMCAPVAIVACCWRAIDPWLRACAALTMLSLIAGILWWGIVEAGGYLLGGMFVLAALAASLWSVLRHRIAVATAVLAIGAQAAFSWSCLSAWKAGGYLVEDRAARVRAHLGTSGVLLSCSDHAPSVGIWLPGVHEYSLIPSLMLGGPPDDWFSAVHATALGFVNAGPLALEASYRYRTDFPDRVRNCMSRLEAALRRDCRVTEFDDPSWPLLLIEKR
ncbi:MAG TPA: hypothetical protein VF384_12970 [Planctomycetota bacterium]